MKKLLMVFLLALNFLVLTTGQAAPLTATEKCSQILYAEADEASVVRGVFERLIRPLEIEQRKGAEVMMTSGFRSLVFQLEELSKAFVDYGGERYENEMEFIYEKAKKLEDALGALDAIKSKLKYAQAHPDIIPRKTIDYLKAQLVEQDLDAVDVDDLNAISTVRYILKSDKWISGKIFKRMRARLDDIEWKSDKKSYRKIRKILVAYVHDIRKKIDDELIPYVEHAIKKNKFDYDVLEDGWHEIRRDLRRVLILMVSLRGIVGHYDKADQDPIEDKELRKISAAQRKVKYNRIPKDFETQIFLSPIYQYTTSYFVEEFGELKDQGEDLYVTSRFIVESGATSSESKAFNISRRAFLSHYGHEYDLEVIRALIKEYQEYDPLSAIEDELEN